MTPLLGFTPDAPTTTPGIIIDCSAFIPSSSGMRAAPSAASQGAAALSAACRGAITVQGLDGSTAIVVGATDKLYTLSGTTYTDRSRAGSPAYALGTDVRWSFAQFGNDTYASATGIVIQKRTAMSGSFADVSGAPQAKILAPMLTSGGGFLFAFNTNATTDTWKCSAVNNADDWTVNPTVTLCNTGRLVEENGAITAAAQLGNDLMVAYKDKSICVGTFVGGAAVWQFRSIPGVGCVGQDAIVSTGTLHYFIGRDNIYLFDGSRPVPIGDGQVRQWFLDNSNAANRFACQLSYERENNLIRFYFPSGTSTTPDKCLVYQLKTQQWGRDDRSIEAVFSYTTPSTLISGLTGTIGALTGTISGLAGGTGTRVTAVFDTAHVLKLLSGVAGASYFTLHDIGDDTAVVYCDGLTLRYMQSPTSATINGFTSMATGGVPRTGATQSAYDVPAQALNRFRLRQTARWHQLQPNFVGDVEVTHYDPHVQQIGVR